MNVMCICSFLDDVKVIDKSYTHVFRNSYVMNVHFCSLNMRYIMRFPVFSVHKSEGVNVCVYPSIIEESNRRRWIMYKIRLWDMVSERHGLTDIDYGKTMVREKQCQHPASVKLSHVCMCVCVCGLVRHGGPCLIRAGTFQRQQQAATVLSLQVRDSEQDCGCPWKARSLLVVQQSSVTQPVVPAAHDDATDVGRAAACRR